MMDALVSLTLSARELANLMAKVVFFKKKTDIEPFSQTICFYARYLCPG
jgi:hypothetical protein